MKEFVSWELYNSLFIFFKVSGSFTKYDHILIAWLTLPKWQGNKSENGYWDQVNLSENGYLAHVSWFKQSHYNTTQS